MFQLFKDRNFSDFINDTFQFFKMYGKHYFKNYFVINGGLLLLATVLIYFFMKVYMEFIFSSISGSAGNQVNYMKDFFNANFGLMIAIIIGAIILLMIISLLQFTFPVVYLDLLDSKKGTDFNTKDIVNAMKKRSLKIIKFVLGSVFILFPLLIIVFGLLILLCFIIIGIPLLFVMIPAIVSFIHLTFFYYMNSEESFLKAISDSFDTLKQQFWPIIGSTTVILIILQIVSTVFTMIPYVFGMASMLTTLENGAKEDAFSVISVMMSIIVVVSTIVSYILNNLLLINQGIIYYSHIENSDSPSSNDFIEMIGVESE